MRNENKGANLFWVSWAIGLPACIVNIGTILGRLGVDVEAIRKLIEFGGFVSPFIGLGLIAFNHRQFNRALELEKKAQSVITSANAYDELNSRWIALIKHLDSAGIGVNGKGEPGVLQNRKITLPPFRPEV